MFSNFCNAADFEVYVFIKTQKSTILKRKYSFLNKKRSFITH